ncbi:DUF3986 family protein [Bacillus thermotolerans]|uniref:DUF3986 family protein n=1 Tax=Bacillus thermotolerans TaxID=1221996 RepID=A0A0F5HWZ4_BACTR|nr:DUF3986 family protein [Bacillus thermotolerans]KKB35348.1 hypothetical protein QY95_03482 [Bacillus thermotolerans]KKB37763.1 hypothetical protein QY97_03668 [Bacillus thermotolerans]KKB38990.1 hypothetical protein QY96_02871 [Bacillus thermotolerans]
MLYDDTRHLHVGYYENGYDLEAVALKRQSEDQWDIFFPFEQYGLKPAAQENEVSFEEFGTRIFSIPIKDLDYQLGSKKFEEWLSAHRII